MRSYINSITKWNVLNLMDHHGNDTRGNCDVLCTDNLGRMRLFVHAAHQSSFQRLDRRRHTGRPRGPLADLAKCLN